METMTEKRWFNHLPLLEAHNQIPRGNVDAVVERSDVSRPHYYDVVFGHTLPKLSTAKRLCDALGVSITDVVDLSAL